MTGMPSQREIDDFKKRKKDFEERMKETRAKTCISGDNQSADILNSRSGWLVFLWEDIRKLTCFLFGFSTRQARKANGWNILAVSAALLVYWLVYLLAPEGYEYSVNMSRDNIGGLLFIVFITQFFFFAFNAVYITEIADEKQAWINYIFRLCIGMGLFIVLLIAIGVKKDVFLHIYTLNWAAFSALYALRAMNNIYLNTMEQRFDGHTVIRPLMIESIIISVIAVIHLVVLF